MKTLAFIVIACLSAALAQAQDITAITGATLVNPEAPPVENATIVIRDGRITAAGPSGSVRIPRGATRIDATGKWIIPGLIDTHVHFFQSGGLYTRPDVYRSDLKSYAQEHADVQAGVEGVFARYLRSGITAVADVGGPMWNFEVRQAARDSALAPRVAVAGPLISSYEPPAFSHLDDRPILAVSDPDEARRLVREQAAQETDFIKVWYIVTGERTVESFLPVYEATVDEARKHGLRVAVHATELETARAAVAGGADILVHGVFQDPVDAAFVELVAQRGVIVSPTLAVVNGYGRTFTQTHDFLPEEFALADPYIMSTLFDLRLTPERISPRTVEPPAVGMANMKALHAAGVTIAAGTDAGNIGTLPGPSLFREMQLMVDAGLSPAEVLVTATLNGAKFLGMEDDLGSITPGKLADMVILDADPLADIRHTAAIHRVVSRGRVLAPEDIIEVTPADLVQRQVNAYNARDIDAFLATYSPDVEIFMHGGEQLMAGLDDMRRVYTELFESSPELHCHIANRIVIDRFVIDHEVVSGYEGGTVEAVALYEVEDGLIRRVRFIME